MNNVRQIALWVVVAFVVSSAVVIGFGAGAPALGAVAKPGGAGTSSGGCPSSNAIGNFQGSSLVGASVNKSASTWTYFFSSLSDLSPTGGIPGLIRYLRLSVHAPGDRDRHGGRGGREQLHGLGGDPPGVLRLRPRDR